MRKQDTAVALAIGSLWGGAMLALGLMNLAKPDYGREFMKLMGSLYPGVNRRRSLGRVLLGGAYGFADGFLGGLISYRLYRVFAPAAEPAPIALVPQKPRPARRRPPKGGEE